MRNELHIVTVDLPHVLDNTQLSDAYFLIKSLHEKQITIHLHCFSKNHNVSSASINEFCSSIEFYDRDISKVSLKIDLPFNVSSRSDAKLIQRLKQDEFPILFIGLAVTYPIYSKQLNPKRKMAVRLNKNESEYYQQLSEIVPWKGKKAHYQVEAWRMKNYLKNLVGKQILFFSSSNSYSLRLAGKSNNQFQSLPLFTGLPPFFQQMGKGLFCLFLGRLSDRETAYAANWLLEHVFNEIEIPFVIAGSAPSTFLENAAHVRQHTCLVANPSDKEMQELIKKAQLILSPAFIQEEEENLFQLLALGRHILINPKKTANPALKSVCHIAQSPKEFSDKVKLLFEKEFCEEEKFSRQQLLNDKFKDEESADKLTSWLS